MADKIVSSVVQTPVVETPVAPVVSAETPVSASVVETVKTPEAASVETTVLGADVPVVEEKTEVSAEQKPAEEKPAEVKTEEVKPVDGEKKPAEGEKTEVKTEEVSVEPPKYDWKFPEGTQVDDTRVAEVNKMFGELEREGKVSHEVMQKYGQEMVNFHVAELTSVAEKVAAAYDKVWKDQTKSWYDDFVKDPEIGGNKKDTTTNAAREFIRRHGGTPEQQTELRTLMEKTGIGNHKAMIRLFAKANLAKAEPKTVMAQTPPSQPSTLKQKMYGKKKS